MTRTFIMQISFVSIQIYHFCLPTYFRGKQKTCPLFPLKTIIKNSPQTIACSPIVRLSKPCHLWRFKLIDFHWIECKLKSFHVVSSALLKSRLRRFDLNCSLKCPRLGWSRIRILFIKVTREACYIFLDVQSKKSSDRHFCILWHARIG